MPEIYVVVEVSNVRNPEGLQAYQAGARAQIGPRGGVVVARGTMPVFGGPPWGMVMIQKWPDEVSFRAWQDSDEYRPLKEMRGANADFRIAIVPSI